MASKASIENSCTGLAEDPRPDPSEYVDHPSGFVAMSQHNKKFVSNSVPGFMAYRDQGRHRVSLAGIHAPEEYLGDLLDAFLDATKQQGLKPLLVQVPKHQVHLCTDRGMTVNQLGATFILPLDNYTFGGTKKMKLRNKIKRGRNAGLRIVELGVDRQWSDSLMHHLREISNQWLQAKRKKELEFMIGELGTQSDTQRRTFIAQNQAGTPCAFITCVPVWGRHPGYLHDLCRRAPNSPVGSMELCNAFAMERMITEGVNYLHFGFTPFITSGKQPATASRFMAWATDLLRRHGRLIYPAESQARYKLKWGTDIVEPEFIAAQPLTVRAVFDLLRLTKSF